MQGSQLNKLVLAGVVVLGLLFVVMNVITARGNALGELYFYLMILSGLIGLLAPKVGFIYLLLLTGYLDMLKRFMVFGQSISVLDLYWALGIAPATMSGILSSVLLGSLQGQFKLAKSQHLWNVSVIILMGGGLVATLFAGGMLAYRQIGDAINTVLYMSMLVVVPVLYQTVDELLRLLKTVIYIFIPSALYMWYHGIFGVMDWEIDYLKLGVSQEIRMLYEKIFRPFGTLNSAHSASLVFSILTAIMVCGPWKKSLYLVYSEAPRPFGIGARIILVILFATAAAFTFTRTGWVVGFATIFAIICFHYRGLTRLFYGISVTCILAVIFGASWMLRHNILNEINSIIFKIVPMSDKTLGSFSLGTFTSRLISFEQLTSNSALWTPFGFKAAGLDQSLIYSSTSGVYMHDAIGDTLMKFGYVPLTCIAIFGIWAVAKMHSCIFIQQTTLGKSLAATAVAGVFGVALAGLASWSILYTFPLNCYLWLFCGVVASLYFIHARERLQHNMELSEFNNEI